MRVLKTYEVKRVGGGTDINGVAVGARAGAATLGGPSGALTGAMVGGIMDVATDSS